MRKRSMIFLSNLNTFVTVRYIISSRTQKQIFHFEASFEIWQSNILECIKKGHVPVSSHPGYD